MPEVLKIENMQCLQHLKKKLSYEVDVLHTDKHENLLQVISIIFMDLAMHAQITCVNLQYLCDILRKKLGS